MSQLILWYIPIYPLQAWLAGHVSTITRIPNNGIFFVVGSGIFEVTPFCAGITSIALLVGLLFGFNYPAPNQKIIFLIAGGIGLFLLNIFRIALVIWVGSSTQNLSLAEHLHTLTWFVLSGIILGTWYLVLRRLSHARNNEALARLLMGERSK